MRPNELGTYFQDHVRRAGGDPASPTVQQGLEAFRDLLKDRLDGLTGELGTYDDVLLFQVSRFSAEDPRMPTEMIVSLDRRVFHDDAPEPDVLIIEWRYTGSEELERYARHKAAGCGPGLPAGEGMMVLDQFLSELDSSPVIPLVETLTPVRTRVTIGSYD